MFLELEKFFDFGLFHPDLNIKNILVKTDEEKIFLLDFDKAVLQKNSLSVENRTKIYKRLFRSFDKMGKINTLKTFSFTNLPDYIEKSYLAYLKTANLHSFLWIFNKK